MKEIRTIKMVEVTDVKFVADDGKEFVGENAERECKDYERTRDVAKVKKAFERVDMVEINTPFIEWFVGECTLFKVQLNSKADFVAMNDYFNVVKHVYDNELKAPAEYPYTMIVGSNWDYVYEYTTDLKAELQKAIDQLN